MATSTVFPFNLQCRVFSWSHFNSWSITACRFDIRLSTCCSDIDSNPMLEIDACSVLAIVRTQTRRFASGGSSGQVLKNVSLSTTACVFNPSGHEFRPKNTSAMDDRSLVWEDPPEAPLCPLLEWRPHVFLVLRECVSAQTSLQCGLENILQLLDLCLKKRSSTAPNRYKTDRR